MTDVQKAEKALAEAKAREKLTYLVKQLDDLKKDYEGKCLASHTFTKKSKARYMGAYYYEKFFMKDDYIVVVCWSVSMSKYPNFNKAHRHSIQFNRNIQEIQLTDNTHVANDLLTNHSFYNKSITVDKFMQLWDIAGEAEKLIHGYFNGKMPEIEEPYDTHSDNSDNRFIGKCISDIGIDVIDFENYPKVYQVLRYKTLPMFDQQRWLPRTYAKAILQWEIDRLDTENKKSNLTRVINRNNDEINIIKDFLKNDL